MHFATNNLSGKPEANKTPQDEGIESSISGFLQGLGDGSIAFKRFACRVAHAHRYSRSCGECESEKEHQLPRMRSLNNGIWRSGTKTIEWLAKKTRRR